MSIESAHATSFEVSSAEFAEVCYLIVRPLEVNKYKLYDKTMTLTRNRRQVVVTNSNFRRISYRFRDIDA